MVYAYDNLSRITSVTDPNSNATSFTYNKNGATATATRPNSLVITNNYDKANRISSVVHSPTGSSGDDITVSYTYDANGQVTQITDGLSNNWTKAYDALLRNTTITTPAVSGTSYTLTKEYDGNGNITKVTDFKSNATSYTYDVHNQRTGITYPDSSTVSYTWNCCRITGVTDAVGSSTLAYDQLSRLTSLTDANSNEVQYTYTSVGRIEEVTDHTGAVTKYFYDLRGGMTKVTADYGTGNAKDTTYTLNANGAVTKQTLPSGHYNDYVYDDGGRITSQTFKTSGGTTVDSYSYNYSPAVPTNHTGYTRTENNGDVYTFVFDRMGRQKQEKKVDSTPTTLYQQDFTYDKNGNRSTMQQQGSGAGITAFTYTYSYDAQGRMTQFTDSGRNYTATVTADANGNITRVQEAWTGAPNNWRTDFTFDYENRLTQAQGLTVVGGTVVAWNTVNHSYDGIGRRIKTRASSVDYAHVYDDAQLCGNVDLTNTVDGLAWVNAPTYRHLATPQISSSGATVYYGVKDETTDVRRCYRSDGTAGDTAQAQTYGLYALINGAAPVYSFYGPPRTKQSELFLFRSLTFTPSNVALPRETNALEIAGSTLTYEGNRVKHELLGRDLNPLGRGDGVFYPAGAVALAETYPTSVVGAVSLGSGNSVNNPEQQGIIGLCDLLQRSGVGCCLCGWCLFTPKVLPVTMLHRKLCVWGKIYCSNGFVCEDEGCCPPQYWCCGKVNGCFKGTLMMDEDCSKVPQTSSSGDSTSPPPQSGCGGCAGSGASSASPGLYYETGCGCSGFSSDGKKCESKKYRNVVLVSCSGHSGCCLNDADCNRLLSSLDTLCGWYLRALIKGGSQRVANCISDICYGNRPLYIHCGCPPPAPLGYAYPSVNRYNIWMCLYKGPGDKDVNRWEQTLLHEVTHICTPDDSSCCAEKRVVGCLALVGVQYINTASYTAPQSQGGCGSGAPAKLHGEWCFDPRLKFSDSKVVGSDETCKT